MQAITLPELNRSHYKRLNWYFLGKQQGNSSRVDGVDKDLILHGLIQRVEKSGGVWFSVTPAGDLECAKERQREIERRKPHHLLASRLAAWLRESGRITWENIAFDNEKLNDVGDRYLVNCRPDVYSMVTTYNPDKNKPAVHEVKVSRADFLSDLANPAKREEYYFIAETFWYVCPDKMIAPSEVPAEAGLIYETNLSEFTVIKKPKRKPVVLTHRNYMNLILKPGKSTPL